MFAQKYIWLIIVVGYLFACAEPKVPKAHNDPSKYTVAEDVLWASPDGFDLTMDIYTPTSGQTSYPVLMIFHGGGWLINDKSIMDQMAHYVATNGDYVVCNVDYRLLGDQDNSVTLDQIVGDVFGAVLWAKENIDRYQGNRERFAVTGDSAGAHLSAAVVNLGHRLSSGGYSPDNLAFTPSYLPAAMSAEQVAQNSGLDVQAAILSYGAFDLYNRGTGSFETWKNPFWYMGGALPRGIFGDAYTAQTHPALYKGVSPIHNIPLSLARGLPPQLLTVGSEDPLTTPDLVQMYLRKLQAAGHNVEYWEHQGRSHAFLDSGSNFAADAPPALDVMLTFLNSVFYPQGD